MFTDILETIGALGVLASAVAHYSIAVTGHGQSLKDRRPGTHGADSCASRAHAGIAPKDPLP